MFSQVTEDERQDFRQKLAAREAEFTRKADELRRQQNELAKAREGSKSRSSSASMLSSQVAAAEAKKAREQVATDLAAMKQQLAASEQLLKARANQAG